MAQIEPMDVDGLASEFDDKENSLQNSNVINTSSTEKGYEDSDVSEFNMKLRYSITPANSPMSRSYTANYKGDSGPNSLNNTAIIVDNNLTRSLNSTIKKSDVLKSPKLPLQVVPASLYNSDRRSCDREGNITVKITETDNDDNLSLPSTSSSALQTPEATTPTKEIPKSDGSPIMRGLKSVLNMFRSSHSPIPPFEDMPSHEDLSNKILEKKEEESHPQMVLGSTTICQFSPAKECQSNPLIASTPISSSKIKEMKDASKRNSPLKDSVVFNDDLERELQWQDEPEIFLKREKVPIHKLLFQSSQLNVNANTELSVNNINKNNLNGTVEYMDVSNADVSYKSVIQDDKTLNDFESKVVNSEMSGIESDNEFVDCETTHTQNKSYILETVTESKTSPVVYQTNNIAYEASYEDYIDPFIDDKIISESALRISEEVNKPVPELVITTNLTSENLYNLPGAEIVIPNDTTNMTLELPMKDHIFHVDNLDIVEDNHKHVDDINNGNTNYSVVSANMSSNPLEFDNNIENRTEYPIATSLSNIQPPVEDKTLQTIVQTNKSCIETTNCFQDEIFNYSEIDIPTHVQNISARNITMPAEDVMNFDTDDTNTARILFDIETLISNQVNPNHNKDIVSQYSENTSEYINKLENSKVLNTSENDLLSDSGALDDTIVVTYSEAMNKNIIKSVEINAASKLTEHLNINALVSKDNVNVVDITLNNVTNEREIVAIEKLEFQNINNSSEFETNMHMKFKNSQSLSDTNDKITQNELNAVNNVVNSEIVGDFNVNSDNDTKNNEDCIMGYINNQHGFRLKNNNYLQDLTIDSLQLNSHQPPFESNTINYNEVDNSSSSIKHNNGDLVSEIETKKTTCTKNVESNSDCKESMDQTITLSTSQILNKQVLNTSPCEDFHIPGGMQMTCDVALAAVCTNIIQETQCSQFSTNLLTSSLQELNVDSKINESFNLMNTSTSASVNQQELNVDIRPTASALPDVVQVVNNTPEKDDFNAHETKTDITDEIKCLDDNIKTKVNDEEIVTSANNSPYVSVTGLDLNLTSNTPVQKNCTPIQCQSKTTISPPISPKCSRKGYNINFDEIENPFATKTNIRMSPPPEEVSTKSFTPVNYNQKTIDVQRRSPNKRMSQSEKKKTNKKRLNHSIDRVKITNSSSTKISSNKVVDTQHSEENKTTNDKNMYNDNPLTSNVKNLQREKSFVISEVDYVDKNEAEFSKCNETIILNKQNINIGNAESRNVFNIPEIDDMNFNPFATKSRICVTPPPTLEHKDHLIIENNIETITESNIITGQVNDTVCNEHSFHNEVQISSSTSNATSSSINTDKDVTFQEVNTEDEDTVEGPFFEAEDLVDVLKVTDIEVDTDTMQFEDLPATSNDDLERGELFIDAEAFKFLLNQNKSHVVADSGKESLFLKFDPLFAKRVSSDGVLAALTSIQKSTPKKMTNLGNLVQDETTILPRVGPSNVALKNEEINADTVSTVSKPMMVVNPAVAKQPVATPRISLPPKTNRQSLNFTSPAMVVIDRLLSLSGGGNTSLLDQDTVAASSDHDAKIVLVQLRDLLAQKELHVHSLKSENKQLRDRLTTLESQVKSLESEGEERLRKVNNLNDRLTEKTKINKSMAVVVEEYERTIASLIAEMEQEKKRNSEERVRLISERDEQTAHLASMESSFNDLHSKYEKCKQIILSMKANEDAYKNIVKEFDENLLKMQKNYDLLKQHATSKLNHANVELEKMNKSHDADVLKFTAQIKRKELLINSLEESLSQKNKAIEELTAICDELINKVGY